jgi:hypothetical protein
MEFIPENAILLDGERPVDAKGGAIAPQYAFSVATPAYIQDGRRGLVGAFFS